MAPPLFSGPSLIACSGCGVHVKRTEATCPHCGAVRDTRGSTAAPLLLPIALGLLLAGCAGDDSMGTGEDTGSSSTTATTMGTDTMTAGSMTAGSMTAGSMSGTGTSDDGTETFADGAEYGVPDTGFDDTTDGDTTGGSDTDSDSDSDSDSGSDTGTTGSTATDTGAMTESGSSSDSVGEPEYGVPTTGIEPLYGVGSSAG